MRVLVIEDGFEYSELFAKFFSSELKCSRSADASSALLRAQEGVFDVLFFDMCFDRIPVSKLVGIDDTSSESEKDYVQRHQGLFILDVLRSHGVEVPAVLVHDFTPEPKRWQFLSKKYAPLSFIPDLGDREHVLKAFRVARGLGKT